MCGIAGYIGPDGNPNDDMVLLERMALSIQHRGPDDAGFYRTTGVGLAHRRLSIIDRSGGHQPIANEDGSIQLVFNGEIYNYQDLRQDLIKRGHRFSTKSDTEVILHLYEEEGERLVNRLQGMFAFALWDNRKKRLFLARDRLGIKPLYLLRHAGRLYFASEIKAFLQIPGFTPKPYPPALEEYLTFRYVPAPKTLFADIEKLPPAHTLTVENGKEKRDCYWTLNFNTQKGKTLNQWSMEFKERLNESIRMRLMSEVPLGAYLSGGLDSSFLVGLMSGMLDDPISTFSVGFQNERFNELPYADMVAKLFDTDHHRLFAEESAADIIGEVIWHLDEPLADAATIPTYLMAKLTRRYVTVVLSGEGSDEMLGGYPKYRILDLVRRLAPLEPLAKLVSFGSGDMKWQRLAGALSNYKRNRAGAVIEFVSVFTPQERQTLYTRQTKADVFNPDRICQNISNSLEGTGEWVDALMKLDMATWLPDDLMLKNDKMTMVHSIEARVPFLDHKLVEFMASIPARHRVTLLRNKIVLRKAMRTILPKSITRRKKTGFTVPIQDWVNNELQKQIKRVLSKEAIESQGFFQPETVQKLITADLNHPFLRRQFWSIFTLALWYDRFINQNSLSTLN